MPYTGKHSQQSRLKKDMMRKLKDRLRGNRIVKVLSLLAALVMPLYFLTMFAVLLVTDDFDVPINHYYLTFLGFYGCIFLCLSWERKWLWLKIVLAVINTVIIGFIILVAFMGGEFGPLLALLQMIIPVIPWFLIFG